MKRILIAELKQEISSFNPVLSTYEDFEIGHGDQILDYHRGLNTEIAGALDVFSQRDDLELVPTYSARAITSGGTLAREAYVRIARELNQAIADRGAIDAVYFSLHGAMASEDEPDPEGAALAELRRLYGETIPIVVSMDLHGIVTDQILTHADGVVPFHTYPHIDMAQTGTRAARLLLRLLDDDEVRPVTAFVPIPALVRGNELITESGFLGTLIRRAQEIEADPSGLSAGVFIGNPFTDVPDLRSNILVTTDGERERAVEVAEEMAADFWAVRERLLQPLVSVEEALKQARGVEGTVIFTDAADATSSGASGDSNVLLRAFLESGYPGRCLIPIVDAPAVEAASAAGIGAEIDITLGGSLDPARFEPLPVRARVRMLGDGLFESESNGAIWNGGRTALLDVSGHAVVVTSRPVSLYDRSLFWAHGQEPSRFDGVVVKSPHCQPHMFAEWAALVLNVDAPGSTSANLPYLGHRVCRRPIFPLDEGFEYRPKAERW